MGRKQNEEREVELGVLGAKDLSERAPRVIAPYGIIPPHRQTQAEIAEEIAAEKAAWEASQKR